MNKSILAAVTILLCAVPSAHARDASFETATAVVYDKNCTKLPPDYLKAKLKEVICKNDVCRDMMKSALDTEQSDFESSKDYCERTERQVKCDIYYYAHHWNGTNKVLDCRTMKLIQ
jgi:hypothetical protein